MITKQTKQLSFEDIKPKRKIRYEQILDRLLTGTKTAKEIAVELFDLQLIPSTERNYTAPRLTELEKIGLVMENKYLELEGICKRAIKNNLCNGCSKLELERI